MAKGPLFVAGGSRLDDGNIHDFNICFLFSALPFPFLFPSSLLSFFFAYFLLNMTVRYPILDEIDILRWTHFKTAHVHNKRHIQSKLVPKSFNRRRRTSHYCTIR